jgi:hypothetical protein
MMMMMMMMMLAVSQLVVVSYSRLVVDNEAELREVHAYCTTKQAGPKSPSPNPRWRQTGTHAE